MDVCIHVYDNAYVYASGGMFKISIPGDKSLRNFGTQSRYRAYNKNKDLSKITRNMK